MTAPFDRTANLARLADETFDVLVVGGGITGVGVALDAAARGLRTALVEKDDFASGTSSKSSKLVHGGLRYLQNGDVRLVYEALHERQRLLRNAPHLVKVMPFLIPMFGKGGVIHPKLEKALGSAMWMYDLTGGARIGRIHRRLSRDETLAHMPTLHADRVGASYLYYDAQADDARLTLTIARTAALDHGAVCVNHTPVVGLRHEGGRVVGATVEATTGIRTDRIEVRARAVVNATGVWADDLRTMDEGAEADTIRPAKGIHVTVPWSLVRNDIAVVVPVPKDKRSVFVVPWPASDGGRPRLTYLGTTDTDHDGPLDDPRCTPEDVDYLLGALNHATTTEITRADVVGTWAGLRPLVKADAGRTADLSRRHAVTTAPSGMVSVTGGKLTTYREMAADALTAVGGVLDLPRHQRRSRTKRMLLRGAIGYDPRATSGAAAHLQERYGGEARWVEILIEHDPDLGRPLVDGLPYLRAEVVHATRHEMARTVDDVLSRRTRALLLARDAAAAAADDVASLMAAELGWSETATADEAERFRSLAAVERDAPGLPPALLPLP